MVKKLVLPLCILYTVILIILSFISVHQVIDNLSFRFDDKLYHFTAYFLLAYIWIIYTSQHKIKKSTLYICIAAIAFGAVIEVLQHRINPSRNYDVYDIVANTIGALVGTFVATRYNILNTLK